MFFQDYFENKPLLFPNLNKGVFSTMWVDSPADPPSSSPDSFFREVFTHLEGHFQPGRKIDLERRIRHFGGNSLKGVNRSRILLKFPLNNK